MEEQEQEYVEIYGPWSLFLHRLQLQRQWVVVEGALPCALHAAISAVVARCYLCCCCVKVLQCHVPRVSLLIASSFKLSAA